MNFTTVTAFPAEKLWSDPLTDLGNARRLVRAFGTDLRYLSAAKAWLVWDGRRWIKDETGQVPRFARQVADHLWTHSAAQGRQPAPLPDAHRRLEAQPEDYLNDRNMADRNMADRNVENRNVDADHIAREAEELADLVRQRVTRERRAFARRSQSCTALDAMVTLAQWEPGVPVRPDELDADPWLLNVQNGTLDLATGTLRPHCRTDLITRLSPVQYDPAAPCPLWEKTLARLLPDPEVRAFVQRAAGYALTGSTREQCVFFWHGHGRNGKTTVLETLRHVLGDYARETPAETLTVKNGAGSIPSDLARLAGARMMTARETEDGQRLAESLIKHLSGGDTMTARYLFHEWFEFTPALKLFLATNHRPVIRGTDEGLWRRLHLIPFDQTLTPDEVDPALPEKLRTEAQGILAWAVRGCYAWQHGGLRPPPAVCAATAAYRSDMDAAGQFLGERCLLAPGLTQPAGALQRAFDDWVRLSGAPAITAQEFSRRLTERGLTKVRRKTGFVWEGVTLLAEAE